MQNLLALRDHKAQSRINKHLKVCKSANKSVIEDAIDNENTAVTLAGILFYLLSNFATYVIKYTLHFLQLPSGQWNLSTTTMIMKYI